VFVPKLAARRLKKAMERAEEKHRQLKAVHILSKFPAFAQISAGGNGGQPAVLQQSRIEATALAIGKKWRRKALALDNNAGGGGETSPLLGSIQEVDESGSGDDGSGDDGEHDPRDHFAKNLLKSIVLMVLGTALVAVFSEYVCFCLSFAYFMLLLLLLLLLRYTDTTKSIARWWMWWAISARRRAYRRSSSRSSSRRSAPTHPSCSRRSFSRRRSEWRTPR
jgi:hypothetical protein